jgi:hypothetical protein
MSGKTPCRGHQYREPHPANKGLHAMFMTEEEFPTHVLQKRTLTIGVAGRLRDSPLSFDLCGLDQLPSQMAAGTHSQKSSRKAPHGHKWSFSTSQTKIIMNINNPLSI